VNGFHPIVVAIKNGKLKIHANFNKLNQGSIKDPFPTPFTKEFLEGVVGKETCISRWLFSCNQVFFTEKDQPLTTSVIE